MTLLASILSAVTLIAPESCEKGADGVLTCVLPDEAARTGDYRSGGWTGVPTYPQLYCGTRPMTLAREPNGGWATFTAADVVDFGEGHPGAFRSSLTNLPSAGFSLNGYWTQDWANETLRVQSVSNGVVRLADAHAFGIGKASWGAKERRYYAVNAREFLDAPGEWFIDRAAKRLHFIPPSDAPNGPFRLVYGKAPLLRLDHRTNEVVRGETFAFGGGNGLELYACENVLIADCTIECVEGQGLVIGGDCRNVTVSNCTIRTVGRGGVHMDGGDRRTLANGNNRIVNCEIYDFGRLQRVYAPGVSLNGCGNAVIGCRLHHAPHSAILYGGNEHLIADNDIHDVILETGDAGAIYTGRDWTSQGNLLRGNFIHDLGRTVSNGKSHDVFTMGIYLDDCDSGDTLLSNRFVRAGCAVMMGGGRENVVRDNVIVDCDTGIHLDSRGVTWMQHWCNTNDASWNLVGKADAMGYQKDPWRSRYPRLAKILSDEPRLPKYNVFNGNAMSGCRRDYDFDIFPSIELHLKQFFDEKTSLIDAGRDCGRGREDSAILNGLALSCFVDRHDKAWSAKLAHGLCREGGKPICTLVSREQITHFVHGLYRYHQSGLADDAMKAEIRTALAAVADRMIANAGAVRLPMVYAAAWKTTGDEKYHREYLKYADEALAESLKVTETGSSFVQMNASLEVIRLADPERAGRAGAVMKEVAKLAAKRFVEERGADGPWLSAAGDLAYAAALVSRIEDLKKLLGEDLFARYHRLLADCYYGVDGQTPLWEAGPARIVSVLGAQARLPR